MRIRAALTALVAAIVLGPVASGAAGPRIVILPILVHTADADSEYVSRGIADMLSARLEQLGGIAVLRIEDETKATTKLPLALETARATDANYVLFGAFTQFGDGASLDVQCAPIGGGTEAAEARRVFIQSGTIADIIPKLDDLVDKVARYVGHEPTEELASAEAPADEAPASSEALDELRERIAALEEAVYADERPADESAEAPDTGPAVPESAAAPLDAPPES